LKILAAINNAKLFLEIAEQHGSFDAFIWAYVDHKPIIGRGSQGVWDATTPLSDRISKDLKKLGFKFIGSTIVYAFLQATGIVNDHIKDCFVFHELTGGVARCQRVIIAARMRR
jgi:DNA-3-methyladenine glycosylase I